MNDQELKKLIWEKFRSQLEAHGATDIEIIFKDVPPKASELAKKGAMLIKIGNVKKHIVWLIKGAFYALTLFVTLATLPDSYEKFKVYYPNTHKIAVETIEYMQEHIPSYRPEYDHQHEMKNSYVIIDNSWKNSPEKFEKDIGNIGSTDYLTGTDRQFTFVASSCLPLEYTETGLLTRASTSLNSSLDIKVPENLG